MEVALELLKTKENVREFFSKELKLAMDRQRVSANEHSTSYIVELLLSNMESDKFFAKDENGKLKENVLVDIYAQYIEGSPEQKKTALKRLGDVCLLVTGFFSDSLKRKLVDLEYYFGMGGTAYWQLSNTKNNFQKSTYRELSEKFKPFSSVLGEVSERMGITNDSDLLRIYEKWLVTGSDRLKGLLSEHGIEIPIRDGNGERH